LAFPTLFPTLFLSVSLLHWVQKFRVLVGLPFFFLGSTGYRNFIDITVVVVIVAAAVDTVRHRF